MDKNSTQGIGLGVGIFWQQITLLTLLSISTMKGSERFITDADGRSIHVTLLGTDRNNITVKRSSDNARFVIPLTRLSEADRAFIAAWTSPAQTSSYRPSSVAMRPTYGISGCRSVIRYSSGGGPRRTYYGQVYSSGSCRRIITQMTAAGTSQCR